MRGDSRLALLVLGFGLAPALIKKSKPLARYVGDHLIKAGEYLKHDIEESAEASTRTAPSVPVTEVAVSGTAEPVDAEVLRVTPSEERAWEAGEEPGETSGEAVTCEPIVGEATAEPFDTEGFHAGESSGEGTPKEDLPQE